jgi:hypothetical protein
MTHAQLLNVMLMARKRMTQCIDCFDVLLYKSQDRGVTERGLDQLLLETMTTLRRVYDLRNGLDAGVP